MSPSVSGLTKRIEGLNTAQEDKEKERRNVR